jgi:hypothetical protein
MDERASTDICGSESDQPGCYVPPLARSSTAFSQAHLPGGEVVLYDDEQMEYHTLSDSAFAVWQLCDGRRTLGDIAADLAWAGIHLPVEAVELAVAELLDAQLLASNQHEPRLRLDRRNALKTAAAAALGGVALPLVSSITAPQSASALSNLGNGASCTSEDTCSAGPQFALPGIGAYCCAVGVNGATTYQRCIPVDLAGQGGGTAQVPAAQWSGCIPGTVTP